MADADGVVLVYNPDAASQDQQISDWFEYFVRKNNLKDQQCIVFAHRVSNSTERFRPRKFYILKTFKVWNFLSYFISFIDLLIDIFIASLFSRVTAALTTNQSGNEIKNTFENFILDISNIKSKK